MKYTEAVAMLLQILMKRPDIKSVRFCHENNMIIINENTSTEHLCFPDEVMNFQEELTKLFPEEILKEN